MLYTDHYLSGRLAVIFVCTDCVLLGVPLGIYMSKSDRAQRAITPILDMLQTLPTFVYLIPLIFLFKITEPKLMVLRSSCTPLFLVRRQIWYSISGSVCD